SNDFNLNVRRYADNSPPPEPHDVRAHLIGGVPTAEIDAQRALLDALSFDPSHAFAGRQGDPKYHDFADSATDRTAIAPLVNNDAGVAARKQAMRDALAAWWSAHSPRLADLPKTRALIAVRSELLDTFTQALVPLGVLDRFKLAGVVATWWTDTLPDLKTVIDNGFPGVIDGWVDAIADAVEDDDDVGPAFDPFAHKLVRRLMGDYLKRIDDARTEIARLKGEKEAFEQSNPPDDADDEELAKWNYAKDLEGQIKALKAECKETLIPVKDLKKGVKARQKIVKAAEKTIKQLGGTGPKSIARAKKKGEPTAVLEAELKKQTDAAAAAQAEASGLETQISDIEASVDPQRSEIERIDRELAPYKRIKDNLSTARATYRELTAKFVAELKTRCDSMDGDPKQALVMELFAQDIASGLDDAISAKRRMLVRLIESLWDKYAVTMVEIQEDREELQKTLAGTLEELGYAN
ncbi:MAG: SAM-dependent DNA methyltransferase, partial [Planctomycetes bacterium]|nr:SAM-dependent DNA methyltransferase [Planctomycetota bacterium]